MTIDPVLPADNTHTRPTGINQRLGAPLAVSTDATGDTLFKASLTDAPRPQTVAILAVHGMGQQVPFETLDNVAQGLILATKKDLAVTARTVRIGTETMQRLEFKVQRQGSDETVDVHVYEAYWAPLTEGLVGILDVLVFLFWAGINGLLASFKPFRIWMFGRPHNFSPQRRTSLQFLAALLVVLSLVAMNAVVGAAVAKYVVSTSGDWPGPALIRRLNLIMAQFAVVTTALVVSLLLMQRSKRRFSGVATWSRITAAGQWLFWFWVADTILSGIAISIAACVVREGDGLKDAGIGYLWVGLWGVLGLVFAGVRYFLIQYLGDVAAYVSSQKLDRFHELRLKIKAVVRSAGTAIFSARRSSGDFLYDKVLVVGHSLGSVAAYDALNALLNEDALQPAYDVASRTGLLMTFGSPLDKVSFVFARRDATDHQRALSASVQPLISDYSLYRQMPWINIYSDRDIISGALNYFDDPSASTFQPPVNAVISIEDPHARIPLVAHTEYWNNPLVYETLYAYI